MFGMRTPAKKLNVTIDLDREPPPQKQVAGPSKVTPEAKTTSKVRRSIGEWETGKAKAAPVSHSPRGTATSPKKAIATVTCKAKPKTVLPQETKEGAETKTTAAVESLPSGKVKHKDRMSEAKACVLKAKLNLGNARNLKTEIKTEVTIAIDRLFQLIKESESVKGTETKEVIREPEEEKEREVRGKEDSVLLEKMEEHAKLIEENSAKMDKLRETLEKHQVAQERSTYASVAATSVGRKFPEQTALHSVVVTAKNELETGEDVLNRIRKVVNAKEGGVEIERIRKAKDGKVIVGCRTEKEREIIKEKLMRAEDHLNVQEVKNKDPLVILRNVFQYNTDEDVLNALRNQNKNILKDLDEQECRVQILYKRRTRNPHTHHIVMRVSPRVWRRLIDAETVQIDLQRVRAEDQSPLVQCSLCLGYGHGKRFCIEKVEKCSHCGGPHMRSECADFLAGETPSCCNCVHAKMDKADHSAFSLDCPVRKKWETLARATVAYC